jgi:hypothetical protein
LSNWYEEKYFNSILYWISSSQFCLMLPLKKFPNAYSKTLCKFLTLENIWKNLQISPFVYNCIYFTYLISYSSQLISHFIYDYLHFTTIYFLSSGKGKHEVFHFHVLAMGSLVWWYHLIWIIYVSYGATIGQNCLMPWMSAVIQ